MDRAIGMAVAGPGGVVRSDGRRPYEDRQGHLLDAERQSIMRASSDATNVAIADYMGCTPTTVGRYRKQNAAHFHIVAQQAGTAERLRAGGAGFHL